MSVRVFFDTNILVYAATGRGPEEKKRKRALELIESEDFCISAQVLQEFYVTVTRKAKQPLPSEVASEWIEWLSVFPCQATDHRLVSIAVAKSKRYRISYWDAAVLAAAEALGCEVLYSEDLNDGQSYGTIGVVDPLKS